MTAKIAQSLIDDPSRAWDLKATPEEEAKIIPLLLQFGEDFRRLTKQENDGFICGVIYALRAAASQPFEKSMQEIAARIIEPEAFAFLDRHAPYVKSETVSGHRARAKALAKAARIVDVIQHRIAERSQNSEAKPE